MPASLTDLVATRTKEAIRQQLLAASKGIGYTRRLLGSGLGAITADGFPNIANTMQIKIVATGSLGSATFQYSLDNGVTWSGVITVPATGTYAVGSTGVTLTFNIANASSVANPYIAGDIYGIVLTASTMPVTAWQPGSVPITLLENDADVDADLSQIIQNIASGGILTYATGDWLTLLAANVYLITRNLAQTTAGLVTLTAVSGVGPYTITAGQLQIATNAGVTFTNTTGGTLSGGGTLQVAVVAVAPGSLYNVGLNTIVNMLTPLAGVTVNNPDPGSGWITSSGSDTESDTALVTRCKNQWAALGIGATAASYDLWARTASANVNRTLVFADATVAGQVDVVLASSSGAVTGTDVTNVTNYIQARQPLGLTVSVQSAAALVVTVSGTVNVAAAYLVAAQQQGLANLQALIAAAPIGGIVYLSEIIAALGSPTGVRNVVLTAPTTDTALTTLQVASLASGGLAWAGV